MTKYEFEHIHIICNDIEVTKNWYIDKMGAEVTFEAVFKGNQVYYLRLGGVYIVLIDKQFPGETPEPSSIRHRRGLDHFGLLVKDLEKALGELKALGVHVIQDITHVREGLKISYIEAPDNVRIEISERS
ncbi:MAG: VOC family protein [Spirochaetia bacterium]|jgi:catechol 2,3-dioxygenase-like lactoylglutathione lyase family enzyme|nr:VOC family protein [Spirochaetia bacterium]